MAAWDAADAIGAAPKSASQLFSFAENANTADASYHNPRVFMDLQVGGRRAGRLVIELFADVVPKTAEVRRARSSFRRHRRRPHPLPASTVLT